MDELKEAPYAPKEVRNSGTQDFWVLGLSSGHLWLWLWLWSAGDLYYDCLAVAALTQDLRVLWVLVTCDYDFACDLRCDLYCLTVAAFATVVAVTDFWQKM